MLRLMDRCPPDVADDPYFQSDCLRYPNQLSQVCEEEEGFVYRCIKAKIRAQIDSGNI